MKQLKETTTLRLCTARKRRKKKGKSIETTKRNYNH
jgi:hypothetical protein